MKRKEPEQTLAESEELIQTVASKIRPLSKDIRPSQRFLEQMRYRLLRLQPKLPSRAA